MPPMPRLVGLSIALYRLMLAAYPAAFRNEYGEVMVQLFHDTALDAHRHRGLSGLSALWLRTLADFTSSVIHQHWEQHPSTGATLSIYHLIRQWLELGGAFLSVLVLSWHYARYVVLGRPMRTWAVVSTLILMVWAGSIFHHLGIFSLPMHTNLEFKNGAIEIRHIYAWGGPVLLEDWHAHPMNTTTITPVMPWEFGFSSGHIARSGALNRFIHPSYYWQLRIPLLLLPVLLLLWASLARPWSNNLYGSKAKSV